MLKAGRRAGTQLGWQSAAADLALDPSTRVKAEHGGPVIKALDREAGRPQGPAV